LFICLNFFLFWLHWFELIRYSFIRYLFVCLLVGCDFRAQIVCREWRDLCWASQSSLDFKRIHIKPSKRERLLRQLLSRATQITGLQLPLESDTKSKEWTFLSSMVCLTTLAMRIPSDSAKLVPIIKRLTNLRRLGFPPTGTLNLNSTGTFSFYSSTQFDWFGFVDWFTLSFSHLIHSFIHSFAHSLIRSFSHSLIHSLIHWFIHWFID
jgi:hypothetical protein